MTESSWVLSLLPFFFPEMLVSVHSEEARVAISKALFDPLGELLGLSKLRKGLSYLADPCDAVLGRKFEIWESNLL